VAGGTVDVAGGGRGKSGLTTVVGAGATVVAEATVVGRCEDVAVGVDPQLATTPTTTTPRRIRSRTAIYFPFPAPGILRLTYGEYHVTALVRFTVSHSKA